MDEHKKRPRPNGPSGRTLPRDARLPSVLFLVANLSPFMPYYIIMEFASQ